MPYPCHALTMPFFSRPQHSTAIERRPCCAVLRNTRKWIHNNNHLILRRWIQVRKLHIFFSAFLLSFIPCGLPGNLLCRKTISLLSKLVFYFACGKRRFGPHVRILICVCVSCKFCASHRYVFLRAATQNYISLLYLHSSCTLRFPLRHTYTNTHTRTRTCVCVWRERKKM